MRTRPSAADKRQKENDSERRQARCALTKQHPAEARLARPARAHPRGAAPVTEEEERHHGSRKGTVLEKSQGEIGTHTSRREASPQLSDRGCRDRGWQRRLWHVTSKPDAATGPSRAPQTAGARQRSRDSQTHSSSSWRSVFTECVL